MKKKEEIKWELIELRKKIEENIFQKWVLNSKMPKEQIQIKI